MGGSARTLTEFIDTRPVSVAQVIVFVLCGAVAFLDGLDTTSIGAAAPLMARELSLSLASFGPVFSAALVGAATGALLLGPLADRFGRKRILILTTATFGIFTLLTAFCQDIPTLLTCRFLAGIGMGGATPCFIALTSEYAPLRHRSAIVAGMWSAFPLGGVAGALVNSALMEAHGWQVVFYGGGLAPLVLVPILMLALPESAGFLSRRGRRQDLVRRTATLRRLFGEVPQEIDSPTPQAPGSATPLRALFTDGLGSTTIMLWGGFALIFTVLIIFSLWIPALLGKGGMAPSNAALSVGAFNLGCTLGMAVAGRLMEWLGARAALVPAMVGGGLCTIALGLVGLNVGAALGLAAAAGALVGIGGAGLITLAATCYPTHLRSTGVGVSMAMGRGAQAIAPTAFGALFALEAAPMTVFLILGALPLLAAVLLMSMAGFRPRYAPSRQATAHG